MQRSGTTAIALALSELGLVGFSEGHLWHLIVEALRRIRDPEVLPDFRDDHYSLGGDRVPAFESHIATAIDNFHREQLYCPEGGRWYDKSPSAYVIENTPILSEMFPGAQFVFIHRHPVEVVESGMRMWGGKSSQFQVLCQGWVDAMSTWREVRPALEYRALEISHKDLVNTPAVVADTLATFIGHPGGAERVAELFISSRYNTSYLERENRDFPLWVEMSRKRRRHLVKVCFEEMGMWGYPVPFDSDGRIIQGMGVTGPATTNSVRARALKAIRIIGARDWRTLVAECREFYRWIIRKRTL